MTLPSFTKVTSRIDQSKILDEGICYKRTVFSYLRNTTYFMFAAFVITKFLKRREGCKYQWVNYKIFSDYGVPCNSRLLYMGRRLCPQLYKLQSQMMRRLELVKHELWTCKSIQWKWRAWNYTNSSNVTREIDCEWWFRLVQHVKYFNDILNLCWETFPWLFSYKLICCGLWHQSFWSIFRKGTNTFYILALTQKSSFCISPSERLMTNSCLSASNKRASFSICALMRWS